jgi:hypothetical protein
MIALWVVPFGGQRAVDIALFTMAKEPFPRGFLKHENGLPSHESTFA